VIGFVLRDAFQVLYGVWQDGDGWQVTADKVRMGTSSGTMHTERQNIENELYSALQYSLLGRAGGGPEGFVSPKKTKPKGRSPIMHEDWCR